MISLIQSDFNPNWFYESSGFKVGSFDRITKRKTINDFYGISLCESSTYYCQIIDEDLDSENIISELYKENFNPTNIKKMLDEYNKDIFSEENNNHEIFFRLWSKNEHGFKSGTYIGDIKTITQLISDDYYNIYINKYIDIQNTDNILEVESIDNF